MSTNVEKPKKSLFTGKKETTSEKKPKPEKAVKGKKASAEKKQKAPKQKKSGKSSKLLSIRNKIVVCFLVPIVFMVIIGVSAYQKIRRRIKREIHRFHITDDAYGHGKSEYEL